MRRAVGVRLLLAALSASLVAGCGAPESSATDAGPSVADARGSETGADATDRDPGPQTLYPLAVGRSWTYQIQSTYPTCPGGERTLEVLDSAAVPAGDGFLVRSYCGDEVVVATTGDVSEWALPGGAWFRMTDEPVEDGHTWTTTNGAASFGMRYQQEGRVATPAGTFTDCWRVVQEVTYTSEWVYCRGVGLVSSTLVDLAGGGIVVELSDKNF